MKKTLVKYILGRGGIVFLIDIMFAVLGLIGLVLGNWAWAQILFGLIMVCAKIAILGMFGYSDSYHGALFINRKSAQLRKDEKDVSQEVLHAKEYAHWKGFAIGGVAEVLPLLLIVLGSCIPAMGRGVQVFSGIWYSSFATLCTGLGGAVTLPVNLALLPVMILPAIYATLGYGIGYVIGGLKKKHLHRELDVQTNSYDV